MRKDGFGDPQQYSCYNFYLKDHLGNIRIVADSTGTVEQANHYYPFGALTGESTGSDVQRYKFNGKELDRLNNLNWYDQGARHYDAALTRFITIDPLAEKCYGISPYVFCMNNPVIFVDFNGEEPTDQEAARIAAHIYGDQKDDILIGGWQVSSKNFNIENAGGLKSQVYEKIGMDGKAVEYVYTTAGTEKGDFDDWIANASQIFGLSKQYDSAVKNARKISQSIGEEIELTYVGHSLGGGEAALNSLLTYGTGKGRRALTFNAAGISLATKILEGGLGMALKAENHIDAYITYTDPLNQIQNSTIFLPDVNGVRKYVMPKTINGHSIENFISR